MDERARQVIDGVERAGAAFLDGADADGKIVETLEVLTLTGWNI
jgi:hypothetical protein